MYRLRKAFGWIVSHEVSLNFELMHDCALEKNTLIEWNIIRKLP